MAVVFAVQAAWLGALHPLATGLGVPAAVAALTLSFGPATGAHFNPLVTASQWVRGQRDTRCMLAYMIAQFSGALVGAVAAGWLVGPGLHTAAAPLAVVVGSEVFASAGLITIVLAASLVSGPYIGLLAVVGWLVMVNRAVPAGPFGNPVLAFSALLAPRSMTPSLVLIHVAAEVAGTALALVIIGVTYPRIRARQAAAESGPVAGPVVVEVHASQL